MRLLIADDQPKVRQALRLILDQEERIAVVGEASEVENLMAQLSEACPDAVLLDWGLLGSEPIILLSDLRQACPGLRVIVLSGQPGVEEDALAAGADVFVSKTDPPEILLVAIAQVHQ